MVRTSRKRTASVSDRRNAIVGVLLIVVTIGVIGGLLLVQATTKAPPKRDAATLCSEDGPSAIVVMLLDVSDNFSPIIRQQVELKITELAEGVPEGALVDLRVLREGAPFQKSVFRRCNPGTGVGKSELTSNPELEKRRWLASFQNPLQDALSSSINPPPAKSSPLIAASQQIAVDDFLSAKFERVPKSLIYFSDMMEHTNDYSHYTGEFSYERFKRSKSYGERRTDLKGAGVTINYITPTMKRTIDWNAHMRFWHEWVVDNRGKWIVAAPFQGK